jgi:Ca-activated chloride channel family protein
VVSSQGTAIADAIHLASTYYDDPQTSKLLILVSDGEDHGEDSEAAAEEAGEKGYKNTYSGCRYRKGGPIPLKNNGRIEGYKKDNAGETVITKLYPDALKTIAERTKGGYVYGGTTREVTDYVKSIGKHREKRV